MVTALAYICLMYGGLAVTQGRASGVLSLLLAGACFILAPEGDGDTFMSWLVLLALIGMVGGCLGMVPIGDYPVEALG